MRIAGKAWFACESQVHIDKCGMYLFSLVTCCLASKPRCYLQPWNRMCVQLSSASVLYKLARPSNNERNSTRSLVKLYWPLASSGFQLDSHVQATLAFAVYFLGDIPRTQDYLAPEFLDDRVLGLFHHLSNQQCSKCSVLGTIYSELYALKTQLPTLKPKAKETPYLNTEQKS